MKTPTHTPTIPGDRDHLGRSVRHPAGPQTPSPKPFAEIPVTCAEFFTLKFLLHQDIQTDIPFRRFPTARQRIRERIAIIRKLDLGTSLRDDPKTVSRANIAARNAARDYLATTTP